MIAKTAVIPGFTTKPGLTAPLVWGSVTASVAAATWIGAVPTPIGLGAITACVVVASATLARRRQQAERRADHSALAMSIGGDGTWDYDLRKGTITYDDRCAQMLGYDRGHVADRLSAWGKLVHPEDLPDARQALDDYLEGRSEFYEVSVRLRDVRGCWRKILDRGRIVERDEDGKPTRVVGIHRELGSVLIPAERVTLPGEDEEDEEDTLVTRVERLASEPMALAEAVDPVHITVDATAQLLLARLQEVLDGMTERDSRRRGSPVEGASELVRRIRRLESWAGPSVEMVPLAAIVDAFAGTNVKIAIDLPIAEADPVLLLEAISLVMDALGEDTRTVRIEGTEAPSSGFVALAFSVKNVDRLEPAQRPIALAEGLLAPMRGRIAVEAARIVLELPRPSSRI